MQNTVEIINYIIIVLTASKDVWLGFVGGVASYMFDMRKAQMEKDNPVAFKWGALMLSASLGMFIGYVVGTFIPLETYARNGLVALSGLTAYNIMVLAESRFATYVLDKITKRKD